jgi:hypothetical protein
VEIAARRRPPFLSKSDARFPCGRHGHARWSLPGTFMRMAGVPRPPVTAPGHAIERMAQPGGLRWAYYPGYGCGPMPPAQMHFPRCRYATAPARRLGVESADCGDDQ